MYLPLEGERTCRGEPSSLHRPLQRSRSFVSPISAWAQFTTPAGDFNALIFNDMNATSGSTEGRLAVGGNAMLKWYSVGQNLSNSKGARDDLIVGGDLNAIGGWQVQKGNAVYGGNLVAAPTTPNGSVLKGAPLDFNVLESNAIASALLYGGLTPTGSAVYDGYSTLTINAPQAGLNIINVDGRCWSKTNISNRVVNAPAGATVLVNVSGTTNAMSGGMSLKGGVTRNDVMWNFYETESLTQSSMALLGSLFAPQAHFQLSGGSVDGQAVLASVDTINGGGFRNYSFGGSLPAVPEPLTLAMLTLGVIATASRRPR